MYTNDKHYGGNFIDVLKTEFSSAKGVSIASGYASLDIINFFDNSFINIARSGGTSRLLLGMAFYEGLTQKKLDKLKSLNDNLLSINEDSGVYVTNGRRYHGKIYQFTSHDSKKLYLGSSNFSSSGTKGNIECTIPIEEEKQKYNVSNFLESLFSSSYSININNAEITVPGKKKIVLNKVESIWNSLNRFDPTMVPSKVIGKFTVPLPRIADKEKSNLNTYFGKGRLNKTTGKVTPRPWYEIEIISSINITNQDHYPKGDFLAYTDDGLIIPMGTQGAYYKNIRSKDSLQIFGIWLKGRLEKAGALKMYEPVTQETLQEYGKDELVFEKFEEGKYFLKF